MRNVKHTLQTIITNLASDNGEDSPREITYVKSTSKRAAWTLSRHVLVAGKDQPVDVVTAAGNFTGFDAKTPRSQPLPRGHYLLATIDASSGELVGWGINATPLDLASLGAVKSLNR